MLEDIQQKNVPKQFGCLKKSSRMYCLVDMINNWLQALDTPARYLWVCFLDFSKAFDRTNPRANGAKRRSGRKPGARVTNLALPLATELY